MLRGLLAALAAAQLAPAAHPVAPRRLEEESSVQAGTYIELVSGGAQAAWDARVRVLPPSQVCPCAWGDIRGGLRVAVPANACVANASAAYGGAIVLVQRGDCDFATKTLHMQRAG